MKRVPYERSMLALAQIGCKGCGGCGETPGTNQACSCVLRAIGAVCLERYRRTGPSARSCGHVTRSGILYSFPNCDFRVDVGMAARRALTGRDLVTFRRYWEYAQPYKVILAETGASHGDFWHAVYRIETRIGRECLLGALYPTLAYFAQFVAVKIPPSARKNAADEYKWREARIRRPSVVVAFDEQQFALRQRKQAAAATPLLAMAA